MLVIVAVPAPTKTAWLVRPVNSVVNVLPEPTIVILPVPNVLILPAIGEIGPPEFPVSVSIAPVPSREIVKVLVAGLPDTVTVVPSPTTLILFAVGKQIPLYCPLKIE